MEGTIKKLLIGTGVLMSATVALLPLTGHAITSSGPYGCGTDVDPSTGKVKECANDDGSTVVNVNVRPTLALKVKGSAADCTEGKECETYDGSVVEIYPYRVETGEFGVSLRSARPYTVSLSADEPSLVNNENENFAIRPSVDIQNGGKPGWGVKKLNADKTPVEAYSRISYDPIVFFDSGTNVSDTYSDVKFPFGVYVNQDTPTGIYSTEVTITAAVKSAS